MPFRRETKGRLQTQHNPLVERSRLETRRAKVLETPFLKNKAFLEDHSTQWRRSRGSKYAFKKWDRMLGFEQMRCSVFFTYSRFQGTALSLLKRGGWNSVERQRASQEEGAIEVGAFFQLLNYTWSPLFNIQGFGRLDKIKQQTSSVRFV